MRKKAFEHSKENRDKIIADNKCHSRFEVKYRKRKRHMTHIVHVMKMLLIES